MSHYRKFKYWIFATVDKMFRYLLREGEYKKKPKHTPTIERKSSHEARLPSLERRVKAARDQH